MTAFQDQTVLVTGAGSGIGQACAIAFAQAGAKVVALDIDRDALARTVQAISDRGADNAALHAPHSLSLDLRDESSVRRALIEWLAHEPVHVLVNCAGIGATCPFLDTDVALLDKMYAINVRGTFLCAQEVARAMVARNIAGSIVNVGSASGARGNAGRVAYGATKAAVANMTQVMAVELAAYKIRVNAVAPGPIETPLVAAAHSSATRQAWIDELPLGRYGQTDEVTQAVLYLAGAQASYVTGHVLYVDGGFQGGGVLRG
jgi:NAD(P)-dependent dehydrogenase (short-subunit alcohol dehydrogenase family)